MRFRGFGGMAGKRVSTLLIFSRSGVGGLVLGGVVGSRGYLGMDLLRSGEIGLEKRGEEGE